MFPLVKMNNTVFLFYSRQMTVSQVQKPTEVIGTHSDVARVWAAQGGP